MMNHENNETLVVETERPEEDDVIYLGGDSDGTLSTLEINQLLDSGFLGSGLVWKSFCCQVVRASLGQSWVEAVATTQFWMLQKLKLSWGEGG